MFRTLGTGKRPEGCLLRRAIARCRGMYDGVRGADRLCLRRWPCRTVVPPQVRPTDQGGPREDELPRVHQRQRQQILVARPGAHCCCGKDRQVLHRGRDKTTAAVYARAPYQVKVPERSGHLRGLKGTDHVGTPCDPDDVELPGRLQTARRPQLMHEKRGATSAPDIHVAIRRFRPCG